MNHFTHRDFGQAALSLDQLLSSQGRRAQKAVEELARLGRRWKRSTWESEAP